MKTRKHLSLTFLASAIMSFFLFITSYETRNYIDYFKNDLHSDKTGAVSTFNTCPNSALDITLSTQAEIDSFISTYGCIDSISGHLYINGSDINDLQPLHCLKYIKELRIRNCPSLLRTDGLNNISVNDMGIHDNSILHDITSLNLQNNNFAYLALANLPELVNLFPMHNIKQIHQLIFDNCDKLTSLGNYAGLTHVYIKLSIKNCDTLMDISGFEESIMLQKLEEIIVNNNNNLIDCYPLCRLVDLADSYDVKDNPGCIDTLALLDTCISKSCSSQPIYTECQELGLFISNINELDSMDLKQAIQTIESDIKLPPGYQVVFIAQDGIALNPQFEIEQGSEFEASIDTCYFLGNYITDLKSFDMPNTFKIKSYPSRALSIYADRQIYYKDDVNAHLVLALQQESFNACRSLKVQLFDSDSMLIDEKFTNVDYNENLEFLLNIGQLLSDSFLIESTNSFRIVISKLNGQFVEYNLSILNTDHPDFVNIPSSNQIPINVIQSARIPQSTSLTSSVTGSVPFPIGYIRKSELQNLQLNSPYPFAITPVSYWYKDGASYDPYVKWIKIAFVGDLSTAFVLTKQSSGGNAIIEMGNNLTPFTNFQTSYFDVELANNDVLITRLDNNKTISIHPRLGKQGDIVNKINQAYFLENNVVRKIIRLEGEYTQNNVHLMNFTTILKLYHHEASLHVDHQDIFTDHYYDHEFIDQLGWSIQGSEIIDDFAYGDNNNNEFNLASNDYCLQNRKNRYYNSSLDSNITGQLTGVLNNDNWIASIPNMSNKFPFECVKMNDTLFINSWPRNGTKNSFSAEEKTSPDNIHLILDQHQGDTLSFKTSPEVIATLIDSSYTFEMSGGDTASVTPSSLTGCNADHNHFTFNVDYYNPAGMAIGTQFSLTLNLPGSNPSYVSENHTNPPVSFCTGSWFAKSKVENGVYDPEQSNLSLGDSMLIKAYPAYKSVVFDDKDNQYGKFTYGCMHDLGVLYKSTNNDVQQIHRKYNNKNFTRTWSFSHYRNIWASWVFSLLHPTNKSIDFARMISSNYRDIGTLNADVSEKVIAGNTCSDRKIGDMAHAYLGVNGSASDNTDRGIFFPWCSDYDKQGHWINPTGHFYSYLLNDDFIARNLYDSWFDNFYSAFQQFGAHRDGIQVITETLSTYMNTHDPRALLLVSIGFTENDLVCKVGTCAGSLLGNYNTIFKNSGDGQGQMANWNDNCLDLYLDQFRDTSRIRTFLQDYFDDLDNEHRYNAFKYTWLAHKLDTNIVNEKKLFKSAAHFLNNLLSGLYHDHSSPYDGYGMLRTYSTSQYILHKIPYFLKFIQENNVDPILTQPKLSHYPDMSFNGTGKRFDKATIYINNPDSPSTATSFQLNPTFKSEYLGAIDTISLYDNDDFFYCSELVNDYRQNELLNVLDIQHLMPLPYTTNTDTTIINANDEWLAILVNGGPDGNGLNQFLAPYNNDGHLEVERLFETHGSNRCPDIINDCNKDLSYLVSGLNIYFLNTLDSSMHATIYFKSRIENMISYGGFPLYYKIYIPNNIIAGQLYADEIAETIMNFSGQINPLYPDNYSEGHLASFALDSVVLASSTQTKFPIAILVSVTGSRNFYQMRIQVDNPDTSAILPDDLYLSTKWEDLMEFKEKFGNSGISCP